jgi:type III pantothenate kinase
MRTGRISTPASGIRHNDRRDADMLLCIDCGNTNTVFSVWDGTQFLCTLAPRPSIRRTADQYYVWFSTLMAHHGLNVPITECIISSTVPRVVFNLRVLCDRYFDTRPYRGGQARLPAADAAARR